MMKKRLATNALLLSSALLFSPAAFALGLGEVTIHSKLNQTLDAEIEILSATQEELQALRLSVPSIEVYDRYDLDRNRLVANLKFNVEQRSGGRNVIRISSESPVQEPFVTFLVQADWTQGKLLREYTVLVDPPTFVPGQGGTSQASTYADPAVGSSYSTGTITRGDVISTTAPAYQSSETYQIPEASDGTRMVQRGDTLSKIASQVKPSSVNLNQAMLAIYRSNPEAFDGNINNLRAGKRLRIPSQSEFGQIDRSAASEAVKEQMADWRAGRRSTGKLELRVPDLTSDTSASDEIVGSTGSITELDTANLDASDRLVVTELQDKVQEYERLLNSKDTELAALQDQLRELQETSSDVDLDTLSETLGETLGEASEGVDELTAEVGNAVEEGVDTVVDAGSDIVDEIGEGVDEITDAVDEVTNTVAEESSEGVDTTAVSATTEPETVEEPVIKAPVAAAPAVETAPWWQSLLKWLGGLLGLGLVGGLGFLGYKKFSNKQPDRDSLFVDDELDSAVADIAQSVKKDVESRYTESVPTLEDKSVDIDGDAGFGITPAGSGTVETPQLTVDADIDAVDSYETSTSGGYAESDTTLPGIDDVDINEETIQITESVESDAALPFEETTLADATSFSGSIELDQNNPIAEADFHMAYGLYDQATELVKGALADEDKLEYKEKLLEIYFVSGNKDEFVNYAASIKDDLQANHAKVWDNVAIMGKQLAPEDALFSGALNAADSDDGLDFAFGAEETGDLEIDSSLFGGADESQAVEDLGAGIDLNFDLESELSAAGDGNEIDAGLDLDLDPPTTDLEPADLDLALDLESSADIELDADLSSVLDNLPDSDDTHQVAAVELDLDIGSATGATEQVAGLDEVLDSTSETLEIAGADSLDFDMGELGLPNSGQVGAELAQEDESDLTLDFGGDDNTIKTGEFNFDQALFGVDDDPFPDATLSDMSEGTGVEMPGSLTSDDEHASTAQITEDDLARMGLSTEPATDSSDVMDATNFGFGDIELDLGDEVSTKLDLARAYIEMDDAENAKSILNEVVAEGSESQANEAKELLSGLS